MPVARKFFQRFTSTAMGKSRLLVVELLKPVTVVVNGVDGEAEPEAGEGVPLEQLTETGTLAAGPVGE